MFHKKNKQQNTQKKTKFDDAHFLSDLDTDLERFVTNRYTVDEDFVALHSIIMKHLDKHAPVKRRRVKCNRLPEWYTSDNGLTRIQRDKCKRQKRWSQYKRLRNKVSSLIRDAKRKHFTVSVEKQKYSKALWNHFRAVNNGLKSSENGIPHEIEIAGERFNDSQTVAAKLNEYLHLYQPF